MWQHLDARANEEGPNRQCILRIWGYDVTISGIVFDNNEGFLPVTPVKNMLVVLAIAVYFCKSELVGGLSR